MGRGGGGVALSSGLLESSGGAYERCLDFVEWAASPPSGDWALARCLSRLGVPLTHAPGMHSVDVGDDEWSSPGCALHTPSLLDSWHTRKHTMILQACTCVGCFGVPVFGANPRSITSLVKHDTCETCVCVCVCVCACQGHGGQGGGGAA